MDENGGTKMEMKKKRIPEVLVRRVMSLYEGAKTRVRVDSEVSDEFEVNVGMHQGSVLSRFHFAPVVDVITELEKVGVLSRLLCADDLFLMSEIKDSGIISENEKLP